MCAMVPDIGAQEIAPKVARRKVFRTTIRGTAMNNIMGSCRFIDHISG